MNKNLYYSSKKRFDKEIKRIYVINDLSEEMFFYMNLITTFSEEEMRVQTNIS